MVNSYRGYGNLKKVANSELLNLYRKDPLFKQRVDESAKRIIRMKIALGLIKPN